MGFIDALKELFGNGAEDLQNTVQENVNFEDAQQTAEDATQNAAQVGEEVNNLKDNLPGQQ